MGVGSGIVYDSVAADEYAECQLKAAFLIEPPTDFALLETILWSRRYQLLGTHLQRMADSAAYFAYPLDRQHIMATLRQRATTFVPGQRYKVRLTLDRTGALQCESTCLEQAPTPGVATVALCGERTDSQDRFLYHKTTQRARYDRVYQRSRLAGHADTLFLNEREEVTEGAISNLFVKRGEWWLTPPLHCGLLNGVYRQHVLHTRPDTREAVLHLQDLHEAEAIAICNAIRGWQRVALHQAPDEVPS
jgi:para-aminobenzoate synthetase/4-amino-4-deoxychorismate lyase